MHCCNHPLADATEHDRTACSHAVASCEISRTVPKAASIKNDFDFKLINAKRGCAGGGHLSPGCLLYVRLAGKSCNAQEKVSCLICESYAPVLQDRKCSTMENPSTRSGLPNACTRDLPLPGSAAAALIRAAASSARAVGWYRPRRQRYSSSWLCHCGH